MVQVLEAIMLIIVIKCLPNEGLPSSWGSIQLTRLWLKQSGHHLTYGHSKYIFCISSCGFKYVLDDEPLPYLMLTQVYQGIFRLWVTLN